MVRLTLNWAMACRMYSTRPLPKLSLTYRELNLRNKLNKNMPIFKKIDFLWNMATVLFNPQCIEC